MLLSIQPDQWSVELGKKFFLNYCLESSKFKYVDITELNAIKNFEFSYNYFQKLLLKTILTATTFYITFYNYKVHNLK